MRNPLIDMAVEMVNAIADLRLKSHTLRSTSEGVEIRQPGRPVLLLTYQAACDYASETDEARNG